MRRTKAVLVLLSTVGLAILFVGLPALKRHLQAVKCSSEMHAVLFVACYLWPDEHGGRLPTNFLSMSNELCNPAILICPDDKARHAATNWANFNPSNNCSYEIVAPGIPKSNTNTVYVRCKIHGYVGYADDRLLDSVGGKMIRPNQLW